MTVEAAHVPTAAGPAASLRPPGDWGQRVGVAFGGAVVAVIALVLLSSWSSGLRPSTFESLRADLRDGSVQQWYAAESFESAPLGLLSAPTSTLRGEGDETLDGVFQPPVGDPVGGLLVWRTWGSPGWQVASQSGVTGAGDGDREPASEESTALVAQLRAAQVPMKPFEFSGTTLTGPLALGGLVVLIGLVTGGAPRVGTRWFWLWVMLIVPVGLGFAAYAVVELVGLRRRPDRPLDRRRSGLVGLVGAIVLSLVMGAVAGFLRSRGVPLPI